MLVPNSGAKPEDRAGSSVVDFAKVESILSNTSGYPVSCTSPLPVISPEQRREILGLYPQALGVEAMVAPAQEFKAKFPRVFSAMFGLKMDPTVNYDAPTPEMIEFQGLENFQNTGRHCVMHGLGTRELLSLAIKTGYLTAKDVDSILVGSLGHDLNKPREVNAKKHVTEKNKHLTPEALNALLARVVYSEQGYAEGLPKQFLIAPDLMQLFTGSGGQTGHLANTKFLIVDGQSLTDNVLRSNIGNLIVNQIDAMLYSTRPRFDKATGKSVFDEPEVNVFMSGQHRMIAQSFEKIYGFMWQMGVGVSKAGQVFNQAFVDPQTGAVCEALERHGEKVNVTYKDARYLGHYAGIQGHLATATAAFFVDMGIQAKDPVMQRVVDSYPGLPADFILAHFLNAKIHSSLT